MLRTDTVELTGSLYINIWLSLSLKAAFCLQLPYLNLVQGSCLGTGKSPS